MFIPAEIIKKKRNHESHTKEEIEFLIVEYSQDRLPDYQMAAWLMAAFLNGLNSEESLWLTQAMLHSGEVLNLNEIPGFKVDKHSTGGVGDKTSLILGPIVAAAGVPIPMIAGRGLGHTGGTIDKLESIPGLTTQLSLKEFRRQVEQLNICVMGQTKAICPADRKMYALRDVTGTIDSIPIICASIMSKKLAEGIDGLVLDVKTGNGAFMKTLSQATTLAERLSDIGRRAGKKVSAFVTSMEAPLGEMIGNTLEVEECISILQNAPEARTHYVDTRELSLHLAAEMLRLAGAAPDFAHALQLAETQLENGKAFEVFARMCSAQGGRLDELPKPRFHFDVLSPQNGYLAAYQTEQIGLAAVALGAGRKTSEDRIDPVAGIRCHKKIGEQVKQGDPIFTLFASQDSVFLEARERLLSATNISLQKSPQPSLIIKELINPN